MRYSSSLCAGALLLAGSAAAAAASSSSYSPRPHVVPSPKQPRLAVPSPAPRTKFCTVKTHGNGSDDSAFILSAFHECNNGGHVLFAGNTTYTVGTAMDWTFLRHIDIGELDCFSLLLSFLSSSPFLPLLAGSWHVVSVYGGKYGARHCALMCSGRTNDPGGSMDVRVHIFVTSASADAYLLSWVSELQPRGVENGNFDDRTDADRNPIDIQGTIKFTDDTDYWQANSFPFVFQNVTSFFKLGGDDVFIYGGWFPPSPPPFF